MCFFKKFRAKRKAKKLASIQAEKQALQQREDLLKAKDINPKEPIVKKEEIVEKPKVVEKKEPVVKEEAPFKYHVSQNKDKGSTYFKNWGVKREKSKRTIKYFDTQLEAIDYANHLAEQVGSSIVIHKVDGTIRKQDYTKKS